MSDYDFNVDDILAEFYKDLDPERNTGKAEDKTQTESFRYDDTEQEQHYVKEPENGAYSQETQSADEDRFEDDKSHVFTPSEVNSVSETHYESDYTDDTVTDIPVKERVRARQPIYEESPRKAKKQSARTATVRLLGFLFALISAAVLLWVGVNIHPESETMTFSKQNARANLVSRLDNYAVNSKADVLSSVSTLAEQAVIKKVYKIPEGQTYAPAPLAGNFGKVTVSEASKLDEIIERARKTGLLDNQELLFSPDLDFYNDCDIEYYLDDTILVICWKQLIEGRVTSFCEIKIADGSQIRRKICEDTYGSSVYLYCSELAAQANAVVAMNSDYYAFRDLGITCYDRTVYRFNEFSYYGMYKAYNVTDTLFINSNGDFVIFKRGTETTREEVQQWVYDNDLLYSIAFGPLMVDNYQLVDIPDYPVGEINDEYSRAGIAQVDTLHYLYMAVSHSYSGTPRCNVHQFARMFYNLGVKTAYCLDGGQTGELFFQGEPYNYIDWGNERTVSDIIYFGSAIGEGASQ